MKTRLNLGIVGSGGRGASFKAACDALPDVSVLAVCDNRAEVLDAARERLGAREQYADYETMIERSDLDAVILGTPMHLHVAAGGRGPRTQPLVLSEECLPDFWKDGMERARGGRTRRRRLFSRSWISSTRSRAPPLPSASTRPWT